MKLHCSKCPECLEDDQGKQEDDVRNLEAPITAEALEARGWIRTGSRKRWAKGNLSIVDHSGEGMSWWRISYSGTSVPIPCETMRHIILAEGWANHADQ